MDNENFVQPVSLQLNGVLLEPLSKQHLHGLQDATADGQLWQNVQTSVPEPENTLAYIEKALQARHEGSRFAFAVIDQSSGLLLGSTSYHDILAEVKRVEIGYTWYRKSAQRTHVNTTCKLLLLTHAFEVLGCKTVGWRADNLNFKSQAAIERLGAKKDGVIRGHALRRDGSIRDTVMYSITVDEWKPVKNRLLQRLGL